VGLITSAIITFGRGLLSLRYRIKVKGLEEIAARGTEGVLFLPNHPALIDPVIVAGVLYPRFRPEALADQDRIKGPGIGWITRKFGARPLPDLAKYGEGCRAEVERVIGECGRDLAAGRNLLLYPGGHLMHSRLEDLGGNSAVESILAEAPRARVVLVRTRGLWGSRFSWAAGHSPDFLKVLRRQAVDILVSLFFFCPRREVTVELWEPGAFPREGGREAMNRAMEAYFNEDAPPALHVPHTPWEPGGRRTLPDPPMVRLQGDPGEVSAAVREQVTAQLASMAGKAGFGDGDLLSRDLGMDSLMRLELQLWIEQEFGHHLGDPDSLRTVGDALLAASGNAIDAGAAPLKDVPSAWFAPLGLPVLMPEGTTVTEVFLKQAARDPGRVIIADQASGIRTYRDILTSILALKPTLEAIEGPYVGIMLPASVGASVLYLAVLFAGKTPVMVNWTTGVRNMTHGLDLLGVTRVLTVGKVVSRIQSQGLDLEALQDRFLLLEEVGASLPVATKVKALLQARFSWKALRRAQVPATAVVLFTSGSENLPKAVPLTHGNLLANLRDVVHEYPFLNGARFIGFLPPFHSFGLTGTILLPLCAGLQVVYYPVPTDGVALTRHIEAYRVTSLVGTPTFLNGIVRVAATEQLESLRFVIAGAEKCPEALFAAIQQRWPSMVILEGYGITECSPVVAANREERLRHGTIGMPMPSVTHAVVDEDSGKRAEPGAMGMLLVRGPSIFPGYLGGDAQPFVAFEGESWYRTGDLVREEDGMLVFAGRLKRFVKMGGEMVSLPAVEEVLLARFSSPEDEETVLAVEAREAGNAVELTLFTIRGLGREAANAAIREAGFSPIHNIRTVVDLEKIPVLGTGKTDYRALKAML
jgi:long-chain-fatty-acid--[acyl-carrier-protein] ligase